MQIICLHDQHCLAAAHQFLHSDNKWWMMNLYSDDMYIFLLYIKLPDHHHKNCQIISVRIWLMISLISSHFTIMISFIICSVFKCKKTWELKCWWAKLSDFKHKNIWLFQCQKEYMSFHNALNKLLSLQNMWSILQIGIFH